MEIEVMSITAEKLAEMMKNQTMTQLTMGAKEISEDITKCYRVCSTSEGEIKLF